MYSCEYTKQFILVLLFIIVFYIRTINLLLPIPACILCEKILKSRGYTSFLLNFLVIWSICLLILTSVSFTPSLVPYPSSPVSPARNNHNYVLGYSFRNIPHLHKYTIYIPHFLCLIYVLDYICSYRIHHHYNHGF